MGRNVGIWNVRCGDKELKDNSIDYANVSDSKVHKRCHEFKLQSAGVRSNIGPNMTFEKCKKFFL